ncbi:MAG: endonuclease/exonuclease/phosphatase family protein [Cellvibrionaceae bacterium]
MSLVTPSIGCLSYNIHKGFRANNRDYVLSEMRDAIRMTGADVVGLQEILGAHHGHAQNHANWHTQAHFEYLADSVWSTYAYGKNAIYQQGHHGNALLSKLPFLEFENHDMTQWRFSQRGLLHGLVNWPETNHKRLHIGCVHLGFLPFEQWRQTRKLLEWIRQIPKDDAFILMGDFNDWHFRIHRTLLRENCVKEVGSEHFGKPLASFPATKPRLPLDRIYYRGLKLDYCEVLWDQEWSELSDHCPVFANFLQET